MNLITIKELQRIETDILKYIDKICKDNNIKYTVVAGTAIGAVRHKGFIPWDDDIDIGLISDDYEKLIKSIKEDKNERYIVLDDEIEETYNYPFAKVIDTRTTLVEENQIPIKNYGVFVDVFRYSGMPNNNIQRFFYYKKLKKYQRYISYLILDKLKEENLIKKIIKNSIRFRANRIGFERLLNKYKKLTNKYSIEESKYCISNWPCGKRKNLILKSDFLTKGTIRYKFDDIEINIMKEYDEYLTTAYGNYMQFPPVDKQKPPHPSNVFWKE